MSVCIANLSNLICFLYQISQENQWKNIYAEDIHGNRQKIYLQKLERINLAQNDEDDDRDGQANTDRKKIEPVRVENLKIWKLSVVGNNFYVLSVN